MVALTRKAEHSMFPVMGINDRDAVIIAAGGTGAGTSVFTAARGSGYAWARSGVGVYTLTLDATDGISKRKGTMVCGIAQAHKAATATLTGLVTYSAGVFTITFQIADGTATDPASGAKVEFLAVLK